MSIARFYDLEAGKVSADGEKVSLFTNHPGALGAFREARLRQYVSEHVPKRYEVSSGFVTDHDRSKDAIYDRSSKQIDCLVHEPSIYAPLLWSADFSVVVPKSVAAVIEVKSSLTIYKNRPKDISGCPWSDDEGGYIWAGTLVDAMINIKSAIDVLAAANIPREEYFVGIIGYGAPSIGQFVESMRTGEICKQIGADDVDQLPDSVCVFDGPWFSVSAFPWDENPELEVSEYVPTQSYLLEGTKSTKGSSLQMFTAGLSYALTTARINAEHTVGGLRSGVGYQGKVINHVMTLKSARVKRELDKITK